MDVITGLGHNDPLRHDTRQPAAELPSDKHDNDVDHDHVDHTAGAAATAGGAGRMQSGRLRRLQRRRPELRDGANGQLCDHDAATCNDHHCRAHWVIVTSQYVDPPGRLRG